MSGLYVIHAQLVIKEDRVDDFIREIKLDAVGSVNEEQGCLRFDVFQDIKTPNHIFLYEVYTNLSAFEYHVTTPHFKKWSDYLKYSKKTLDKQLPVKNRYFVSQVYNEVFWIENDISYTV